MSCGPCITIDPRLRRLDCPDAGTPFPFFPHETGPYWNTAQTAEVTKGCDEGVRVEAATVPYSVEYFSATLPPGETAALHGFSAPDDGSYDSLNPTSWKYQFRKFTTLVTDGSNGFYIARTSGPEAGIDTVVRNNYDGEYSISANGTAVNDLKYDSVSSIGMSPVTPWDQLSDEAITPTYLQLVPGIYTPPEFHATDSVPYDIYRSEQHPGYYNLKVTTGFTTNPVVSSISTTTYYSTLCFKYKTYQSPYESALLHASAVVGSLSVANIPWAETTLPGSTGPLGFHGTVVSNRITVGSSEVPLVPGRHYRCVLRIQRTSGIERFHYDFTATGETKTFDFDMPIFVGEDYWLHSVCTEEFTFGSPTCFDIYPSLPECQGQINIVSGAQQVTAVATVPDNTYSADTRDAANALAYAAAVAQATDLVNSMLVCEVR